MDSTILIIDDNPDDVEITQIVLTELGRGERIVTAAHARDALDYLQRENRRSSLPSLVLLDLKMPRMSGFEILERIRRRRDWQDLPVLILSGSDQEKDIKLAMEEGANAAYKKPVNLAGLVALMKDIQKHWLGPAKEA